MFSTGHLSAGVAAAGLLGLSGAELVAFVAASVLADWDYPLGVVLGVNHRRLPTHSPLTWTPLLLLAPAWPLALWIFGGLMLHFALDLFDHGIPPYPGAKRLVGLRLFPVDERWSFGQYLRAYARFPLFVALESGFLLLAAGTWWLRAGG